MKTIFRLLSAVYVAGILVAMAVLNPSLLFWGPSAKWYWTLPSRPPVIGVEVTEPSSPVTFTYRGGPERTGVVDHDILPLNIVENWRSEPINHGVHGASKSSPAVDDTGIYLGSDTGWFYRFDHGGKTVWKFHVDRAGRGIHGTALLDQNYVYFGSYSGHFFCLRKSDGRLQWMTDLLDAVGSSPLADGEFLYVAAETGSTRNGRLYKLSRESGEVIWQTDWLGEQVHSSPTLSVERGRVSVGANNGTYFSFSAESGEQIWETRLGGAIKGTAALIGRVLYVASWGKDLNALDVDSGAIKWSAHLDNISQASPAYVPGENLLIVSSSGGKTGTIYGIRAGDGRIVWKRASGSAQSKNSALVARAEENSGYYVWTLCEGVHLCALRPADGHIVLRLKLPNGFTGQPTLHRGHLYVVVDKGPLIQFMRP